MIEFLLCGSEAARPGGLGGGGSSYDPYIAQVAQLSHFDDVGLDGATTITAPAARSSTQSKFGGFSVCFAGGLGDVRYNKTLLFAADFTIEGFVYPRFAPGDYASIVTITLGAQVRLDLFVGTDLKVYFEITNGVGTVAGTTPLSLDTWNFISARRRAGVMTLAINGVLEPGSNTDTTAVFGAPTGATIIFNDQSLAGFDACFDEFRITDETARSYAVPLAPYPNI